LHTFQHLYALDKDRHATRCVDAAWI